MRTKLLVGAGIVSLVTGCCLVDMEPPQPGAAVVKETVELVGFLPATKEQEVAFLKLLNDYDDPHSPGRAIFRVRRFKSDHSLDKSWGGMSDDQIGCRLLNAVTTWLQNPLPEKQHTILAQTTVYSDRLGMMCSTSCAAGLDSARLVDRFKSEVLGYHAYHNRHHH